LGKFNGFIAMAPRSCKTCLALPMIFKKPPPGRACMRGNDSLYRPAFWGHGKPNPCILNFQVFVPSLKT
jgi:hypothetical protein